MKNLGAKDRSFWPYLTGAWLLIAIPIFFCNPAHLNQDTYQYLATSNYYLQAAHWHIRDAYTVGPVIPALVAVAKSIAQAIFSWSPDLDVGVVKFLSLACYTTILASMILYNRRYGVARQTTAFALTLVFFTLPPQQDVVSLNGELVCSALFALFFVAAVAESRSGVVRQGVLVIIALLILYTKLQAIILLGLCFGTVVDVRMRSRLIITFLAGVLAIEVALLFTGGGGWLPKMTSLAGYVGAGQTGQVAEAVGHWRFADAYLAIGKHFTNLWWAAAQTLAFFPLAIPLILAGRLLPNSSTSAIRAAKATWWALATLVTIAIPGRQFEHYTLFWFPFVVLFLGPALRALSFRPPPLAVGTVLVALMLLAKFFPIVPTVDLFTQKELTPFGPRQFISVQAEQAMQQIRPQPQDTIFVHGWDYRYYSLFNKYFSGPAIMDGAKNPEIYAARILADRPTYILDVVNHSGLVRDARLALAAQPLWSRALGPYYSLVFDAGGLVIYRRRDDTPSPSRNPRP